MTEVYKRQADPQALVPVVAKRGRYEDAIAVRQQDLQSGAPARTSNLQAPIMLLTGHSGEIYTAKFSHDTSMLASAGFDTKIMFWNVYGDCENFSHIRGHKGAILDIQFSPDDAYLYSAASDHTVRAWDLETGKCARNFKSHTAVVNACHPARRGPSLLLSGGDDGKIFVHDMRKKEPAVEIDNIEGCALTAVSFNDGSDVAIVGGIENVIRAWDLRKQTVSFELVGHTDTVTHMALSPTGDFLLTNSMDDTARVWDVKPFAQTDRLKGVYGGHQHNFEKNLLKCAWAPDSKHITCGSSDRFSYVWNVKTKEIVYKLPGHLGSVNAVDFHPREPILLSAGSDKQIFLGELDFH